MIKRKHFLNGRKENKLLVWLIDESMIETAHVIFNGSILITYISNVLSDWSIDYQYILYTDIMFNIGTVVWLSN